jgi:hypothetical protein
LPITPALRGVREEAHELEANLGYTFQDNLDYMHKEILSQKKMLI